MATYNLLVIVIGQSLNLLAAYSIDLLTAERLLAIRCFRLARLTASFNVAQSGNISEVAEPVMTV